VTLADEPAPAPLAPAAADGPARPGTAEAVAPAAEATHLADTRAASDRRRLRLGYVPELDGIRGVAVLMVVMYHLGIVMWPQRPGWFFPGGQAGVDVFFALSGFLITALLLGEHGRTGRIAVGDFLRRRLLRLLPALGGLMAGLGLANLVTDRYPADRIAESAAWVLTFRTNLGVEHVVAEAGHTWSMSVEVHFYLAWCLVVAVVTAVARRPYRALAGVAAAGVVAAAAFRWYAYADDGGASAFIMYLQTVHRIDAPLLGALAGVAWVAGWLDRVPPRMARWAAGLALVALALVTTRTHALSPIMFKGLFTGIAVSGAVLVVAAQLGGPGGVRSMLTFRPLVVVGTISYSVYLWHLPVMMFVSRNATAWPVAQQMSVAVAASLGLGALSYYGIERPIQRRKGRLRA
jgi:peptidoglycan/LPS O-acetylase OafA/YrhL